jgi:hypothetical protein
MLPRRYAARMQGFVSDAWMASGYACIYCQRHACRDG